MLLRLCSSWRDILASRQKENWHHCASFDHLQVRLLDLYIVTDAELLLATCVSKVLFLRRADAYRTNLESQSIWCVGILPTFCSDLDYSEVIYRSNKHVGYHVACTIYSPLIRTFSGNAHVLPAFNENFVSYYPSCCFVINWSQGISNNNKWTLALSIFYVGYCELPMKL